MVGTSNSKGIPMKHCKWWDYTGMFTIYQLVQDSLQYTVSFPILGNILTTGNHCQKWLHHIISKMGMNRYPVFRQTHITSQSYQYEVKHTELSNISSCNYWISSPNCRLIFDQWFFWGHLWKNIKNAMSMLCPSSLVISNFRFVVSLHFCDKVDFHVITCHSKVVFPQPQVVSLRATSFCTTNPFGGNTTCYVLSLELLVSLALSTLFWFVMHPFFP